eukprot:5117179-Amphidinium_carterae.1
MAIVIMARGVQNLQLSADPKYYLNHNNYSQFFLLWIVCTIQKFDGNQLPGFHIAATRLYFCIGSRFRQEKPQTVIRDEDNIL